MLKDKMRSSILNRYLAAVGLAGLLLVALAGVALAGTDRGDGRQEGEQGQPIVIRWSTESEVDTAGYNIYRAESEDGPWTKINDRLIPGSPDPLRGGSYVYTDTNVIAGTTYIYELEEVELNGRTTRLERTQAEARPKTSNPLAGLPCASGALVLVGTGIVLAGRRSKYHARH
jgi:hypothetical protein